MAPAARRDASIRGRSSPSTRPGPPETRPFVRAFATSFDPGIDPRRSGAHASSDAATPSRATPRRGIRRSRPACSRAIGRSSVIDDGPRPPRTRPARRVPAPSVGHDDTWRCRRAGRTTRSPAPAADNSHIGASTRPDRSATAHRPARSDRPRRSRRLLERPHHGGEPTTPRHHLGSRKRDEIGDGRIQAVSPKLRRQAIPTARQDAYRRRDRERQLGRAVARGVGHDHLAAVAQLVEEASHARGDRAGGVDRGNHHGDTHRAPTGFETRAWGPLSTASRFQCRPIAAFECGTNRFRTFAIGSPTTSIASRLAVPNPAASA